jgi:hypothetical protein
MLSMVHGGLPCIFVSPISCEHRPYRRYRVIVLNTKYHLKIFSFVFCFFVCWADFFAPTNKPTISCLLSHVFVLVMETSSCLLLLSCAIGTPFFLGAVQVVRIQSATGGKGGKDSTRLRCLSSGENCSVSSAVPI